MKPFLQESNDNTALSDLGRASVQIVHDLKNQLNGLKLYATFLRKRLEKSERPADELATINKLIAGLDRTARDVSLIVEYGRPLELKKQAGTNLERIMREVAAALNAENLSNRPPITGGFDGSIVVTGEAGTLEGEFDPALIADALKCVSLSAMKIIANAENATSLEVHLRSEAFEGKRNGVIEWKVLDASDHDPFHSFTGSNEIRLSLAARVIEAHGGSAKREQGSLIVRLPLAE
jgi:hypothetical protein